MNSKELVKIAIEFKGPTRIPLCFREDPTDSDIVCVGPGLAKGWQPQEEGEDEWNCVWDNLIGTGAGQVKGHPIKEWDDFKSEWYYADIFEVEK